MSISIRDLYRFLLSLLLFFGLAAQPAFAGDVPCTTIISEVNRRVTRRVPVDISEMARKLDTKIVWIESCLKAYGRRYRRPGLESDGGREQVLVDREEGYEEDREDIDDPDEPDRR